MTRPIEPTPPRLVEDGRLHFGTFDRPFEQTNAIDADILPGVPVPRALRSLRLKEWQAFQFGNAHCFVHVALFNAKVLAMVQLKIHDRASGRTVSIEKKIGPWALSLPTTMLDSQTVYRSGGDYVGFRNELAHDRVTIVIDLAATRRSPRVVGSLTARTAGCEPMVVSMPFADNRGMYSHKGLVPVEGRLQVGDQRLDFDLADSHLLMDDHKGYYPYVMRWDWLTAAGRDDDGRLVGLNLTRNQCIEPERYNENGFWIDGKLHLLPAIELHRDGEGGSSRPRQLDESQQSPPLDVWTARDRDGRVDVRFEVEIDGRVDVNALVIQSKYRGSFGRFYGRLVGEAGAELELDGMFGMGEDFFLRC